MFQKQHQLLTVCVTACGNIFFGQISKFKIERCRLLERAFRQSETRPCYYALVFVNQNDFLLLSNAAKRQSR